MEEAFVVLSRRIVGSAYLDLLEVDELALVKHRLESALICTQRVGARDGLSVPGRSGQKTAAKCVESLEQNYLNCCNTFLISALHSRQRNVPLINSGRTSPVRVTVPTMLINLPISIVFKSRSWT